MSSEVRELLDACPEERQVMMFTGTINQSEAEREKRFMKLMHCVCYNWLLNSKFYNALRSSYFSNVETIRT